MINNINEILTLFLHVQFIILSFLGKNRKKMS